MCVLIKTLFSTHSVIVCGRQFVAVQKVIYLHNFYWLKKMTSVEFIMRAIRVFDFNALL